LPVPAAARIGVVGNAWAAGIEDGLSTACDFPAAEPRERQIRDRTAAEVRYAAAGTGILSEHPRRAQNGPERPRTAMRRNLMFRDRADAGRRLAERLAAMALSDPVVLTLPRGGVPVGAEIAKALGAPLDVALVRKIGAPGQPELAVGAIADGDDPEIVLNHKVVRELGLNEDYVAAEATRELATIERRRREYQALRPALEYAGRDVIVVDDGVATGMTMQAALRHIRRRAPRRLIAAAPVASREGLAMLRKEADEVVCLAAPRGFGAVGSFYAVFTQVSDEEVAALLEEAGARRT
jgi:putative phosphoribosyl transferase